MNKKFGRRNNRNCEFHGFECQMCRLTWSYTDEVLRTSEPTPICPNCGECDDINLVLRKKEGGKWV